MTTPHLYLYALPGIPDVPAGADVAELLHTALQRAELTLQAGDVLVVTHKIVSKAEGQRVKLDTIRPSAHAQALAEATGKDPRLVEVILSESRGVIRQRGGVLIMETHHGWICANAGVDRSNVVGGAADTILLLPRDPDASARNIRAGLQTRTGVTDFAVIISDTHGRPWREGTVNVALGVAGMLPLADLRGQQDLFGYTLQVTVVGRADELAAAAGLIIGQAAEGLPVALIRGASYPRGEGRASDMQRPPEKDLFR